jgi:hypothetical protein
MHVLTDRCIILERWMRLSNAPCGTSAVLTSALLNLLQLFHHVLDVIKHVQRAAAITPAATGAAIAVCKPYAIGCGLHLSHQVLAYSIEQTEEQCDAMLLGCTSHEGSAQVGMSAGGKDLKYGDYDRTVDWRGNR